MNPEAKNASVPATVRASGLSELSVSVHGLNATDERALRRRRARLLGWFTVLAMPAVVAVILIGVPEPPLRVAALVLALGQMVVGVALLRRPYRFGDAAFLGAQLVMLSLMIPGLVLTTPPGTLRSAELVLLGPVVVAAVFSRPRWHVAVVVGVCILGAQAITLHRLAGQHDRLGELVGELLVFLLIALVVRTLQESAQEAVVAARRGELTDPLTGLPNRRGFEEQGCRTWDRQARERRRVALLVVDVDHFKQVNDTHGHAAGDEVLRRMADLIRADLRSGDLAVRLGGEEFVVVLAPCDVGEAAVVAERLRLRVESELAPLTVSIGAIETVPEPGATADLVAAIWRATDRADTGLYQAKRSGRNRVVVVP